MKHFDFNRKHGKPSKQTTIAALVNQFLKTESVLNVPHSGRQTTGRSTANIPEILTVRSGVSADFRQDTKLINNYSAY